MTPIILLFIGLLLVYMEFYLPGGIMGVAGAIVLLLSIVLYAMQSESILRTLLFISVAIVGVILLFPFALWRIRSAKPEYSVYSIGDQEGYVASQYDKEAVGKTGIVITDLRPGGHIVIEGKRHQAISESGYIAKGEEVKVIGGEGESLFVKLKKKETS